MYVGFCLCAATACDPGSAPVLLEKQLGKTKKRLTTKKTLYVKILKRGHFSYSLRIYRALRSVARKKKEREKGRKSGPKRYG